MFHVEKRGKVFTIDTIQMDLFALFNLPQFQNSISLAHYMESKQNCIKKHSFLYWIEKRVTMDQNQSHIEINHVQCHRCMRTEYGTNISKHHTNPLAQAM